MTFGCRRCTWSGPPVGDSAAGDLLCPACGGYLYPIAGAAAARPPGLARVGPGGDGAARERAEGDLSPEARRPAAAAPLRRCPCSDCLN